MPSNIENDKVVSYYERIAEIYDSDRFENSYGRFLHHQETAVLEKLEVRKSGFLLDLACGTGRFLQYAHVGVDASAAMVEIARQKYPGKDILVSDAENLPYEDMTLDTILCFHLFMHLDSEKVQKIIQECHRVLKENGRLIFDIPSQKRRNFLGRHQADWHGAYASQPEALHEKCKGEFDLKDSFGIMLIPVHRLPKWMRAYCLKLDYLLSNSFLKAYSSYIIGVLVKKHR